MNPPVINLPAAKAFLSKVEARKAPSLVIEHGTAFVPTFVPPPLTPLQQVYSDAKDRARRVCRTEPGVCSVYDLGEEISWIEAEAGDAWAKGDTGTGLALEQVARRLKQLIPALRDPLVAKVCPHCGAEASVKLSHGHPHSSAVLGADSRSKGRNGNLLRPNFRSPGLGRRAARCGSR